MADYPFPVGASWKEWGSSLVRALIENSSGRRVTDARPVQLASVDTAVDKATTDGILMWDAVNEVVVVSKNGAWVNV